MIEGRTKTIIATYPMGIILDSGFLKKGADPFKNVSHWSYLEMQDVRHVPWFRMKSDQIPLLALRGEGFFPGYSAVLAFDSVVHRNRG